MHEDVGVDIDAVVITNNTIHSDIIDYSLSRKVVSEFTGTMLLVSTIIGSGIMGSELSSDDGIALLGNTISTIGMLYVIINIFGKISGAHFNPLVTLMFWFKKDINNEILLYIPGQLFGGIMGTILAHNMFNMPAIDFPGKERDSSGEFISEIISTFGLLNTILGTINANREDIVGNTVSMYIMAGYWFTLSTCFANPAVTIARTFTPTFAGISFKSWPVYFGGQIIGFILALPFSEWLFKNKSFNNSIKIFIK
tara:strand:+ start:449 stop:1210 length:762 start_codon:yes stop_codon:yes gene_type:complete